MELFCVLVGAQEVQGSIFSVDVNAGLSINGLKKTIKNEKKNDLEKIDADRLKLYLAKRDDAEWLSSTSDEVNALKKGDTSATQDLLVQELNPTFKINEVVESTLPARTVHILVILTDTSLGKNKRPRADEWFIPEKRQQTLDKQSIEYFEMKEFPPMVRDDSEYKNIMIRKSYRIIFDELMKQSFTNRAGIINGESTILCINCKENNTIGCAECIRCGNYVVTGNPGTGKSRLYLYFIWRIIQSDFNGVRLVINCGRRYHEYCFATREFERLTDAQVDDIQESKNVLRLIDGLSDRLLEWRGVSILFVSPGHKELNEYRKAVGIQWILPPWSRKELELCNTLLKDKLRLDKDVLKKRFEEYGGIPRFIFTKDDIEAKKISSEMNEAIASYDALKIIEIIKRNESVKENNYSHRVLQMIPDTDNFLLDYHLAFASPYVVKKIIKTVNETALARLSEFAFMYQNDPSGSTSSAIGHIYEMMCHRWMGLRRSMLLQLRSLSPPTKGIEIVREGKFEVMRYDKLGDLAEFSSNIYYWPLSKTFAGLDAFIVDNGMCYWLQYTLNPKHGIVASAIKNFTAIMEAKGVKAFSIVFVTAENIAKGFTRQSILKVEGEERKNSSKAHKIPQYVLGLNPYWHTCEEDNE